MSAQGNLRDIYRYFGGGLNTGSDRPWDFANTSEMSDADFYSNILNNNSSFSYSPSDRGPSFNIRPDSFLGRLNQQYGDTVGFNDPRSLYINYQNLPRTRFGGVDRTAPVEQGSKLINPYLVYEDPNYGRITPMGNVRTGNEWLGPTLMALVGAGMGSLAGPASGFRFAQSAMRGLQGAFNRNPMALAGMVLPQLGTLFNNPLARIGTQYFLGNLLRNRSRGRG